ncbi:hypothetical protein [Bradyrhizobium sp. RDM4]|uniref:hypothetical protein n=1 Tax=Bradyrhizobium sp. RDM4 TaxID=3378765 RepID=UPI0038FCC8CD
MQTLAVAFLLNILGRPSALRTAGQSEDFGIKRDWSWKRKPTAASAHRVAVGDGKKIKKLVLMHNHNDSNRFKIKLRGG